MVYFARFVLAIGFCHVGFGMAQPEMRSWDWTQRTSPVSVDRANVIETLVKQGKDRTAAEKEADQVVAALSSPQSKNA